MAFLKSTWNFPHLDKKDQLDSSSIWEVIDFENCAYLNAKTLFFQNTHRESTCSRVPNTVQICAASLLFKSSINLRQIELDNISVNEIQRLRAVS